MIGGKENDKLFSAAGSKPMAKMITAVYETYEQTGPNSFHDVRHSRNFSTARPIEDILNWVRTFGVENPSINSVKLCDYSGDSL